MLFVFIQYSNFVTFDLYILQRNRNNLTGIRREAADAVFRGANIKQTDDDNVIFNVTFVTS